MNASLHRLAPVVLVIASLAAQAQPASAPSSSSPATPAAAHVRTDALSGVKYLTGGVGQDEQQAIQAEAAVYPFHLIFSRADGAFLVVDQVTVRDKTRLLLSVSQAGPLLLAKLPPGKYAVEATSGGKMQARTIEVAKGAHKSVAWTWS